VLPKFIVVSRPLKLYTNAVLCKKVITFYKAPLNSAEVSLLFRNCSCTCMFQELPSVLGSLHTLPAFKLRNCYYLFTISFLLDPNVRFEIFTFIYVYLSGCNIFSHIHKKTNKVCYASSRTRVVPYSLHEGGIENLYN
jgi:hypothetical protein